MALKSTLVTKDTLGTLVSEVMSGQTFVVAATAPTGYTRQFQHQDWIDFVDPVQAGGNNGFNERFHALESEFDLISAAITSVDSAVTTLESAPPAIGLTVALSLSDGASIPVPAGFQASECQFFAFPKLFNFSLNSGLAEAGFRVFANTSGTITAKVIPVGSAGQSITATGIAIAKKGGW